MIGTGIGEDKVHHPCLHSGSFGALGVNTVGLPRWWGTSSTVGRQRRALPGVSPRTSKPFAAGKPGANVRARMAACASGSSGKALPLQPGQSNAAHEVLLEYQEDDQRGDRDQNRTGHDGLVVGAAEAVGHAGDDERQRQFLFFVEDDQGPQVGIERGQEHENGQRREDRLGQG